MLRILHAADFHLDAPFAGLPADRARQRRAEQRQLLDALADEATEGRADLVLLAGDLLDNGETYRETVQALASALGRIPAPVFIAPGNHDYYSARCLYAGDIWPRNVHVFRSAAPQAVELEDCTVYGVAFTAPVRNDSPLAGFHVPASGKPAVMVAHGDVNSSSRYAPVSREEIGESGLAYLALGHIHTFSGLEREGDTFWCYPGCMEGRGFDETGEKGVVWVELEGRTVRAQFLPMAKRRYEILECDLTGENPEDAVTAILAAGNPDDICRLILTGESEGLDLTALARSAQPLRWSVTLRDHTRLPHSVWEREREDTLTGLFLRDMRRRIREAESPERRTVLEQAVRFGLAALENGEDAP